MLIILAGLPGSGKSTLARALARHTGAVWLRIDSIEQALTNSSLRLDPVNDAGYMAGYALAEDNLRLGHMVIADSVNPWELTRQAWRDVAGRADCAAIEVEVICSDAALHRRRVEARSSDIAGLRLPTWQQVQERDYHPWARDRLVVDTAVRDIEACVAYVVGRLPAAGAAATAPFD